MKRLIAATIALTFFASTAAMADGWHGHDAYGGRGYQHQDNTGAVVAVGLGLAALAVIASQHHDRGGYYAHGQYGGGYGYDNTRYRMQNYRDQNQYGRGAYQQDYQRDGGSYRHD